MKIIFLGNLRHIPQKKSPSKTKVEQTQYFTKNLLDLIFQVSSNSQPVTECCFISPVWLTFTMMLTVIVNRGRYCKSQSIKISFREDFDNSFMIPLPPIGVYHWKEIGKGNC